MKKFIAICLVSSAVVVGAVVIQQKTGFLTKNLKKQAKQPSQQEISKTKFDLDGKVTAVDLNNKSFKVLVQTGSKSVIAYKNKEMTIYIANSSEIMDQKTGETNIETIHKDEKINIKGTIKDKKYYGEMILLNPMD